MSRFLGWLIYGQRGQAGSAQVVVNEQTALRYVHVVGEEPVHGDGWRMPPDAAITCGQCGGPAMVAVNAPRRLVRRVQAEERP